MIIPARVLNPFPLNLFPELPLLTSYCAKLVISFSGCPVAGIPEASLELLTVC